jgi:hypothetical protein
MERKKANEGRSWFEEHGGTIIGAGVMLLLGLVALAGMS